MKLYGAFDVHSRSNHLAIIDERDRRIFKKKLPNDAGKILIELEPYRQDIVGLTVESTYNWYWLVDSLMEEGYQLHLANPAAIQKYKGLKYSDDSHDAFWLAHLLRLGILPEGYIYPKEERPVRDLLRKRGHLVQLRTSLINSLQDIIARNCGVTVRGSDIKKVHKDHVSPYVSGQEDLALSGGISKDVIDYLGRKIRTIERAVESRVTLKGPFLGLQSIPGVGTILSLTIMLETGPIERFPKAGNYASYCRKAPSTWISNSKAKGKGNKKNGNKYLAWAFSEYAKAFYNRKKAKKNFMVAHMALANKLTRAAYYIMRDEVVYDPLKLFA
jgi:transposase